MAGGYIDDKWVQGGENSEAYSNWHWYLMDIFVYFSHNLVTIPPPCWVNTAHTHGVKVPRDVFDQICIEILSIFGKWQCGMT